MSFMDGVRERVRGRGVAIVLPDGLEERAQRAAVLLRDQDLVRPILLGHEEDVRSHGRQRGLDLEGIAVRDSRNDPSLTEYATSYHELRKHKGISPEVARERAALPHYFGALMVRSGSAAGLVSGLNSATKPFVPAFEVVKLRPGFTRASSVFIMAWPDKVLFYADCSVNIAPDAATLAEIGRATAATARAFGFTPKVAMLSFSTRDSAEHESIDRVKEAVALLRAAEPGLDVDGEMQFDAAFVPAVAGKKCPDSPLRGEANVFVFPDINAGNIAYKITERLAGASAIGPIMQGLNKPMNDVSRGCSVQDLADVAVITAAQALG
jgi:phosphate acetyltransferase